MFINGSGDLLINASAYDGTTPITTSNASFSWQKLVSGTWQNISGETTNALTVEGSSVTGTATFRCTMVYNTKTYYDTITFIDKTDNFQASIESSGGNMFKNTVGQSTLTGRVFQNGSEVDTNGSLYTRSWYRINNNGQVIPWEQYDGNGNIVGEPIPRKTGKTIDITSRDVDIKTVFVCEILNNGEIIAVAQYTIIDISDPVLSGNEPSNPVEDMLWIDTSVTPNELKRWNDTEHAWVKVSDSGLTTRVTQAESNISQQGEQILLRATKTELNTLDNTLSASIGELEISARDITGRVGTLEGDMSTVSQTANKINWIVDSGTSSSDMQLTSDALSVIADNVDLRANDTVRISSADQISIDAVNNLELRANGSIISTVDNITSYVESNTSAINESISNVRTDLEQTNNALEARITQDELETYLRYEVDEVTGRGTVEIGQKKIDGDTEITSDYKTQTDNEGFRVVQNNSTMTEIRKNTVVAPIVEAKRMIRMGNHLIKLSNTGHLNFC